MPFEGQSYDLLDFWLFLLQETVYVELKKPKHMEQVNPTVKCTCTDVILISTDCGINIQ